MSAEDTWVDPKSDSEIKAAAERIRKFYRVTDKVPVDIIEVLRSSHVLTVSGEKKLRLVVSGEIELEPDDANTTLNGQEIVVQVKKSVFDRARWGDGRARMTLAHELAHAVLHPGSVKARKSGAQGRADGGRIPAHRSAEHQAKLFASAFLVKHDYAARVDRVEDISTSFGISIEAANIVAKEIEDQKNRDSNAALIQSLAKDFKNNINPCGSKSPQYLAEFCTSCGRQTLIPIASKYLCVSCDTVTDCFQDGDRVT